MNRMSNRLDGPLNPIADDWEEPRKPTRQDDSPPPVDAKSPDKRVTQGISMSRRTWALLDQYVSDHYDNRSRLIERLVNLLLEGKINPNPGGTVLSEGRRPL